MAKLAAPAIAVVLLLAASASSHAQTAQVTIDKIEENSSISGHVTGLDSATAKGFRVVVYVHTDIWYVHPYAGQGDGQSWSSISANGSWSVATVKREFPADELAAVAVGQGYAFPARTPVIEGVKNIGIIRKRLKGTDDYSKL